MKRFSLILLLSIPLSIFAQTACESNYQLTCDEQKRVEANIEAAKKALDQMYCLQKELAKRKEQQLACIANERTDSSKEESRRILLEALDKINAMQTNRKPVVPCLTGNCN